MVRTVCLFFFNETATTEIYPYRHTLSLHDALPISGDTAAPAAGQDDRRRPRGRQRGQREGLRPDPLRVRLPAGDRAACAGARAQGVAARQRADRKSTRLTPVTNAHLVCRLLLEQKKYKQTTTTIL